MARKRNPIDPADAAAHGPQAIPRGVHLSRNTLMPGYRVRHDGWTEERTQRFLDALSHTGCVRDAARVAGVSNQAGYRLKARFPAFAAAWNAALARAQQGLIAIAYKRAVEGRETVIIRKGEEVERRIQPSDSMLGLLIKRGDLEGDGAHVLREDAITFDEWQDRWRFDQSGKKVQQGSEADAMHRVDERLQRIRANLISMIEEEGTCFICGQAAHADLPLARFSLAELCATVPVEAMLWAAAWDGTPGEGARLAGRLREKMAALAAAG